MGGRSLGARSHAASFWERMGAGTLGTSRMGGRALGACSGRWPRRGLGAGSLGGGGLGAGALEGGTRGQGVDPGPPWASGRVDTWPLAVKLVARTKGAKPKDQSGSRMPDATCRLPWTPPQ
jgi:hypothetical protein